MLSGVLSSFLNIFNIFVGILARPGVLLELNDCISSSISSGSVETEIMFVKLSYLGSLGIWYLYVWSYPLFFVQNYKKFVERMCNFKGISYLLIIKLNTVNSVAWFLVNIDNWFNSLPCFFKFSLCSEKKFDNV